MFEGETIAASLSPFWQSKLFYCSCVYENLTSDNLAIMVTCMGTSAKAGRQSGIVFRAFSIIIWLESAIITIHTKLPGGNFSPFSKGVFIRISPWTACSIAFIFLKHCLIQMLGIIGASVWEYRFHYIQENTDFLFVEFFQFLFLFIPFTQSPSTFILLFIIIRQHAFS
jgi:hypothetical protein